MTQEDETMEDIVYVDNILPVFMQCMSSDENKSCKNLIFVLCMFVRLLCMCIIIAVLNKKSNMTSCATPSISTSSVPIIKVQAPKKMSTSQSEASLPEKSFTIRGKAVASIQNQQYKIPMSDMMKRKKNKDVIESCIEQLSKSASDIAARITRPTETITNTNIEELNFLQYLIKQIPDNKKLLCISDFFRVAEIYRKGASPSIKET